MIVPAAFRPAIGVAGLLCLVIGWEMASGPDDIVPPISPPAEDAALPPPPEVAPGALAETILARPLFVPSRRPAGGGAVAQGDAGLPRLAGIVIDGRQKLAVFQRASEKPQSVGEGQAIGNWTIQTITRHQVVLQSSGGTMTLEPAKDSTSVAGGATLALPPGLPAPLRSMQSVKGAHP